MHCLMRSLCIFSGASQVQYVPRYIRPGARYPLAALDPLGETSDNSALRAKLAILLDLTLPDTSPALTVAASRAGNPAGALFIPPWADARHAAAAVVRVAAEKFCKADLSFSPGEAQFKHLSDSGESST